jgi:hypothetical protein
MLQRGYLHRIFARLTALVGRLDPATHPAEGPISKPALFALVIGIGVNLFFFLKWRYQPMMDFPFHAAHVRYVAEWPRSDSVYREIFERPDLLSGNTLFYSLGALVAQVFNPLSASRFLVATMYVAGYPLAMLYSLRAFDRSAWGAVLANALVFERLYIAGFAAELIGFPLALLAFTLFYRLLGKATVRRALVLAVLLCAVFLAHSFIFIWTGVVLAAMSLVAVPFVLRGGLRSFGRTLACVLLAIAPALALMIRWTVRSSDRFGVRTMGGGAQAEYLEPPEMFRRIAELVAFGKKPGEQLLLACFLLLVGIAVALARLERRRSMPVLELVCVGTFFTYFLLPLHIRGEGVVCERQLDHAMWLTPALVGPVSARASRLARYVIIAGILVYSYARTSFWYRELVAFEGEARGLGDVMERAPPRLHLLFPHFNILSNHVYGNTEFWHTEGYYVADRGGLIYEVPGAEDPHWWLHFRPGRGTIPALPGQNSPEWPLAPGLWDNYDLVLVRGWQPSRAEEQAAESHASIIAASGEWELWRKNP